MPTLRQAVKRLRDRWILPPSGTVSVKDLNQRFHPVFLGSMQSLLLKMNTLADVAEPVGGSTRPYYRKSLPKPQIETDFVRVILSLKQAVNRLHDKGTLPPSKAISVKALFQQFQPVPPSSVRFLLVKMLAIAEESYINLTNAHMEPYGVPDPVTEANRLFEKRAAAAVHAAIRPERGVRIYPNVKWVSVPPFDIKLPFHVDDNTGIVNDKCCVDLSSDIDLLEMKYYGDAAPSIYIPTAKCLPAMAYLDYFPKSTFNNLSAMVSQAILAAAPGWCGTLGPTGGGDYDMSQMHLLQIAYRYYDKLDPPDAQEHLIRSLLERGRIRRYGTSVDDIFTSGSAPNDWSRAGHVSLKRIGETENHILMMHTARYLTNQLLYQRDHNPNHDNRRNGSEDAPTCTDLMLYLLRNILRDDFSEYNAKPYQTQTRYALLNLCSYAYDHEVRLAARMALDYISAHIAVSSNDLRRMVPFRRRNEDKNVKRNDFGSMEIGLLETTIGADPMAQHFAILAGNTRIYGRETPYHPEWNIYTGGSDGNDAVMYALSDYRLPPLIHDLFVSDRHRRFFQTLHRTFQDDEEVTGRNADNFEIYASSPSYLISAGGSPATYAIDPTVLGIPFGDNPAQQLGVAVTTSFMPTTRLKPDVVPLLNCGDPTSAIDLIQFGHFSDSDVTQTVDDVVYNYGVAPDFACGHQVYLPLWCQEAIAHNRDQNPDEDYGKFKFVDRGSAGDGPGFFLAFFQYGNLAVMEAFDTWLHPDLTFEVFKRTVHALNIDLMNRGLHNEVADVYRTQNGNLIHFIIWDGSDQDDRVYGANIISIDYSGKDPVDSYGDASNKTTDQFLHGTVMNSGSEEAVIEITNHFPPFLGRKIRLDMNDPKHPKRTSETGEVEEAGSNHEVWVNFGWKGPSEGDFFRPFDTITAAAAAVADGGVIKIMPGWTTEKPFFQRNKRIRLVAPIGGVTFGPDLASTLDTLAESLLTLAQQLIAAQRIDEVSPVALDAIQAYRRAVAKGAEATGIAATLASFSLQLAGVGLSAESISAAQTAVDVLRGVQPPTTEQATYLDRLAGCLLTLAQRLIAVERINEVSPVALESIQVYRQAVTKGAEATGIAATLASFSLQLAGVGLSAESISAAQTAVDVLRGVQPPATEQATYLDRLAGCLLTLSQQLIAAQRVDEVSPPALEAIQTYRQAVAKGAEATGIVATLSSFSLQLAGVGLSAEATSAAQAAKDLAI